MYKLAKCNCDMISFYLKHRWNPSCYLDTLHHRYDKRLSRNLPWCCAAGQRLSPRWPENTVRIINAAVDFNHRSAFCCVLRGRTSMAAFQAKLKGSSLSWYDPGHSVIITRFLLTVILLPQILIPVNGDSRDSILIHSKEEEKRKFEKLKKEIN